MREEVEKLIARSEEIKGQMEAARERSEKLRQATKNIRTGLGDKDKASEAEGTQSESRD